MYAKSFYQFFNESLDIGDLTQNPHFIRKIKDEWGPDYLDFESAHDLNDGYCIKVAEFIKSLHPSAKIFTIGNPLSYHVFVEIHGKFYDAVNTYGVNKISDLHWVKEHPSSLGKLYSGIHFIS